MAWPCGDGEYVNEAENCHALHGDFLLSIFAWRADKEHGTVISEVTLYVSPDLQRAEAGPRDARKRHSLMDHTKVDEQTWAHLLAVVDVDRGRGNGARRSADGSPATW